jgi:hypothetical protein
MQILARPSDRAQHQGVETPGNLEQLSKLVQSLYGRRECTPETAPLTRRLAIFDRGVLPRWHIDDTGWRNRHRGFHHLVPAGAYAGVRAWNGREDWLAYVVPTALAVFAGDVKAAGVSRAAFTSWAAAESFSALPRTGRRCIVRPDKVGQLAELHRRTVQKCRALAVKLGLRVVVFAGRMLNVEEKWRAWNRGSKQRGLSAEVALTSPVAVDNRSRESRTNTPTRGRAPLEKKSPKIRLTRHAARDERTETASRPRPKGRAGPLDRRALIVARDLEAQIPWLRGSKPHEIIPKVHKFATDRSMPWTAQDVIWHMDSVNKARGFTSPAAAFIKTNPAGLLGWYLRDVDPQADHPRLGAFLSGTNVERRPQWCGVCDQRTRQVEIPGGLARCPACHQLGLQARPHLQI